MNLQGITAGAISAVNPMVWCSLQVSTGNVTNADYSVTPSYATAVQVLGQVQSLQYRDLQMVEGLNLNGSRYSIYIQGEVDAVVRPLNKGGDLITFPDGSVYLVAVVAENWNPPDGSKTGWCRVIATLQNGA